MLNAIVPIVAALIALAGSAYAAFATKRTQDRNNEIENWSKLSNAFEVRLSALTTDVATLSDKVKALEEDVETERRLSRVATDYVRLLLAWIQRTYPEGVAPPPVPELLEKEV